MLTKLTISTFIFICQDILEPEEKLIYSINEVMEYISRYPGIAALLQEAIPCYLKDSIAL